MPSSPAPSRRARRAVVSRTTSFPRGCTARAGSPTPSVTSGWSGTSLRSTGSRGSLMEVRHRYPFYAHSRHLLRLPGGRPLEELTVEAVVGERVEPSEIGIHPETLRAQAGVAEAAGFRQLAESLRRAAELAQIPDAKILAIYEALRPGRSTPVQLEAMARELEEVHRAPLTAAFVREAAGGS